MVDWLKQRIYVSGANRRIVLPNGSLGHWLLDTRPLFLSSEGLRFMARQFWKTYADREVLQIAAPETAGVPLLPAIVLMTPEGRTPPRAVMVRKERKRTGLGNRIEGDFRAVDTVMIDDIVNSATSVSRACEAVAAEGGTVTSLFTLCDFQSRLGREWSKKTGVTIVSVVTLAELGLDYVEERRVPGDPFRMVWSSMARTGDAWMMNPKSRPTFHEGMLFSGTDTGVMRALDAATGRQIWSFHCPSAHRKGIFSIPAIQGDHLHFGAYDGNAYCLDWRTGGLVWKTPCCDWIGASPAVVPRHGVVVHGLEFAQGRAKGAFAAFDLADGCQRWTLGNSRLQHGSAAYDPVSDRLYLGTADYDFMRVHPATGVVEWRYRTKRSIKYAPAVDAERGLVAAGSFDGNLYVLDMESGEERFVVPTGDILYTTPLFHDGALFFGSGDRRFYRLDLATGEVTSRELDGRIFGTPIAYDGLVVATTTAGTVLGLDPVGLAQKRFFVVPDGITNGAIRVEDDLVVSTVTNDLYRLAA